MKHGKILVTIIALLCLTAVFAACDYNHEHDWAMRSNANEHWQVCVDDGTEQPDSRAAHLDADNDGRCDECGYILGDIESEPEPHDHQFGEWLYSATEHWKQCAYCTETSEQGYHVDGDSDGKCDECGFTMSQELPDDTGYWIVGNFTGWAENYLDQWKFTRQTNVTGGMVFTFEYNFASGDKFKIVNNQGASYYDGELNATLLTAQALQYFRSEGSHQNIQLSGAPGLYRITVTVLDGVTTVDAEPLQ